MSNPSERASIIVFSGNLDKVLAAFIIATGAAASGIQVDMFFTFWGLAALRKKGHKAPGKKFMEKMFGAMLPANAEKLPLSSMHMAGMGTAMMKMVMKQKKVASLPELIALAREMGVNLHACEMSMRVLGLKREELLDGVKDVVGVASYLADASQSQITLFI
jgi:peroxiredoxin family protein